MKVAIVAPVYKKSITDDEKYSLETCLKLLGNYDFYFVGPDSLQEFIPHVYGTKSFLGFDDFFFKSISSYNKLLLSPKFYEKFEAYDYILIHQLDSLVFQNSLEKWLYSGLDYVGAPWTDFDKINSIKNSILSSRYFLIKTLKNLLLNGQRVSYAGNGGLSLRKVNSFLRLSNKYKFFANNWESNEDYFWSILIPMLEKNFVIPDYEDCKYFSIEHAPEKFYEGADKHFGCHAWDKNKSFWESILI